MDDITVITLATEPKYYLPQFLASCRRFGVVVAVEWWKLAGMVAVVASS